MSPLEPRHLGCAFDLSARFQLHAAGAKLLATRQWLNAVGERLGTAFGIGQEQSPVAPGRCGGFRPGRHRDVGRPVIDQGGRKYEHAEYDELIPRPGRRRWRWRRWWRSRRLVVV